MHRQGYLLNKAYRIKSSSKPPQVKTRGIDKSCSGMALSMLLIL